MICYPVCVRECIYGIVLHTLYFGLYWYWCTIQDAPRHTPRHSPGRTWTHTRAHSYPQPPFSPVARAGTGLALPINAHPGTHLDAPGHARTLSNPHTPFPSRPDNLSVTNWQTPDVPDLTKCQLKDFFIRLLFRHEICNFDGKTTSHTL